MSFLTSHGVLALASGADETIRSIPLEFSWHDDAIWIFSEGGLKFRGLKEHSRVAASVYEPNAKIGCLKVIQIEGEAEMGKPYIYEGEYMPRDISNMKFTKLYECYVQKAAKRGGWCGALCCASGC